MKQLHFTKHINAPKEKVWHAMLDDESYREWTKAFSEGSYFEGSWEKGAKIQFLGPNPETGELSGMSSRIAENKPYEFISIEHVGIIANGVEDTTSEEAKKWVPAFENYTFVDKDGGTEVQVELDVVADEYADMFDRMWPEALKDLKTIAERA